MTARLGIETGQLSRADVGDIARWIFLEAPGFAGFIARTLLRHALVDHRRQYDPLAASPLDWVLVRATRLAEGPRTGTYRLSRDGLPPRGGEISRAGDRVLTGPPG
jgi:hypothetical protein